MEEDLRYEVDRKAPILDTQFAFSEEGGFYAPLRNVMDRVIAGDCPLQGL